MWHKKKSTVVLYYHITLILAHSLINNNLHKYILIISTDVKHKSLTKLVLKKNRRYYNNIRINTFIVSDYSFA